MSQPDDQRKPSSLRVGRRAWAFFIAGIVLAASQGSPMQAAADTGNIIHVSPVKGNDANAGSSNAPLRSISAAVAAVRLSITIVLAAGLYRLTGQGGIGLKLDQSGTKERPIRLRTQGGEATIDCSAIKSAKTVYCLHIEADWWNISNIAVTGAKQNSSRAWAVGINIENASYNTFQYVRSFGNQGPGIVVSGRSQGNVIQDCESFSNFDPRSAVSGGNADGIQITKIPSSAVGNVIARCRSFNNSDDGFDLWRAEAPVTIQNSEASANGFVPGTDKPAGDGVGFKLGKNSKGPRHQIINNLAVNNRAAGFDSNGAARESKLIGNRARGNGGGSYR